MTIIITKKSRIQVEQSNRKKIQWTDFYMRIVLIGKDLFYMDRNNNEFYKSLKMKTNKSFCQYLTFGRGI